MTEMVISGLKLGVPVEQLAETCGLSVSDVEAIKNSPLIRLYLNCVVEQDNE